MYLQGDWLSDELVALVPKAMETDEEKVVVASNMGCKILSGLKRLSATSSDRERCLPADEKTTKISAASSRNAPFRRATLVQSHSEGEERKTVCKSVDLPSLRTAGHGGL